MLRSVEEECVSWDTNPDLSNGSSNPYSFLTPKQETINRPTPPPRDSVRMVRLISHHGCRRASETQSSH